MSTVRTKDENSVVKTYIDSLCPPKTLEEAEKHDFKFWNTQPVVKIGEKVTQLGEISEVDVTTVRKTAVALPKNFNWVDVEMQEVEGFLNKYCFEDIKSKVREQYSVDYLNWKLTDPDLRFGVKVNNVLVAFIGGSPRKLVIDKDTVDTVDVCLMCIHPKMRCKRMTTTLIKELTRRAQLKGYSQGYYNTARYLPTPFCTTKLYNRPINVSKLVDVGFLKPVGAVKYEDLERTFKVPKRTANRLVELDESRIDTAYELYNQYTSKYSVYQVLTKEEFVSRFINPAVSTYLVMSEEEKGKVIDMISYYKSTSTVINNDEVNKINTAYMYFYTSTEETAYRLVSDLIVLARDENIDVLYALDNLENNCILKELKFEGGLNIDIHHYLYNWRTVQYDPQFVALSF